MLRWALVLVLGGLVLPSAASGAGATRLVDRALGELNRGGACLAIESPARRTTDVAPPAEVLRRYGLFRAPQPDGVPVTPLQSSAGGALAARYERTRVLGDVTVTVAPILDWRPPVRSAACDVRLLAIVRRLGAGARPAVRRGAEAIVRRMNRVNADVRALPPRTILAVATTAGPATTGALALSAQRGLFLDAFLPPGGGLRAFAGLVPDGITSLTARSPKGRAVTATTTDNLIVLRLPTPAGTRRPVTWQVTDTSGPSPRPYRKLVTG